MGEVRELRGGTAAGECARCGTPVDAQYFDVSTISPKLAPGRSLVLARFELPPQYCGVLEYFSQFTDAYGESPRNVETPNVRWTLRVNQRPLYPYLDLGHIVNPWGFGCYPVRLRLDEHATLELVARFVKPDRPGQEVNTVGGRIVGRYWYDTAFAHAPAGSRSV